MCPRKREFIFLIFGDELSISKKSSFSHHFEFIYINHRGSSPPYWSSQFWGVVPPNNHCDIKNFLCANGCEELAPWFIAEEIEVRQIPQISNQDLLSLGVQTIGARLHLRSAAASWEPP